MCSTTDVETGQPNHPTSTHTQVITCKHADTHTHNSVVEWKKLPLQDKEVFLRKYKKKECNLYDTISSDKKAH